MGPGDFCTASRELSYGDADVLMRPGVRIPRAALAKMAGRPLHEIRLRPPMRTVAIPIPAAPAPEPTPSLLSARKRTPPKDRDTGIPDLPTNVRRLLERIARFHGCTVDEISGRSRVQFFVLIRNEAFWTFYQMRDRYGRHAYSQYRLGQIFARDHTSIMHAINSHAKRLEREVA